MTPPPGRWLTIAATLAVSWSLGCGGAPKETAQGAASGATPVASQRGGQPKRNACDFVDRAEIEKMAGTALNVVHDIQDTDLTVCEMTDPTSKIAIFSVTVYWSGGKDRARAQEAALSMAQQMLKNAEDADMAALTGSEKAPGLADKAFYSDVLPSWVLKGDVMIEIIAPTWDHAKTRKAFVMTATKAVSML